MPIKREVKVVGVRPDIGTDGSLIDFFSRSDVWTNEPEHCRS